MERALWVLVLAAVAALVMYGMRRGWVNRSRRQSEQLPDFPSVPDEFWGEDGTSGEPELLPEATGFYVGTTMAGDWQDRVTVGDVGHRAEGVARLRRSGLLLERAGASALWIPAASIRDTRVATKLANKVIPGAGMLVVTWALEAPGQDGEHRLDTGFRTDDKSIQNQWVEQVRALAPGGETGEAHPAEAGPDETRTDETASPRQEEK